MSGLLNDLMETIQETWGRISQYVASWLQSEDDFDVIELARELQIDVENEDIPVPVNFLYEDEADEKDDTKLKRVAGKRSRAEIKLIMDELRAAEDNVVDLTYSGGDNGSELISIFSDRIREYFATKNRNISYMKDEFAHYSDKLPLYVEETMAASVSMKNPLAIYSLLESFHGCHQSVNAADSIRTRIKRRRNRKSRESNRLEHERHSTCIKVARKRFMDRVEGIPGFRPAYVYKARNKRSFKLVALKYRTCFAEYRDRNNLYGERIHPRYYNKELTSVCREAHILRELRPSNFVVTLLKTIFDTSGAEMHVLKFYYVFEYCQGRDLKSFMQICQRSFTVKEIQAVASNIVLALEDLKKHGVVHRNICVENVLLSRSGLVKLCDFEEAETLDNDSEDTSVYVDRRLQAPELNDGAVDVRTDIWGFGILLLEMYIGFNPLWNYRPALEEAEEMAVEYPESGLRMKRNWLYLSMDGKIDKRNSKYPRSDLSIELEELIFNCVSVNMGNRPTLGELSRNHLLRGVVHEIRSLQAVNFECKDHRDLKQSLKAPVKISRRFSFSQKAFIPISNQDDLSSSSCSCSCTLTQIKRLVSEVQKAQHEVKKVRSPLHECWLCRTSPDAYDNDPW